MFLHWLLDCLTRAYISTKAGGYFFYSTGFTFVGYFVTRRMMKESVLFPVTIYEHSVQQRSQTRTTYQTQPLHNKLPVSHFKKLTWENKVKAWARMYILGLWSSPGKSFPTSHWSPSNSQWLWNDLLLFGISNLSLHKDTWGLVSAHPCPIVHHSCVRNTVIETSTSRKLQHLEALSGKNKKEFQKGKF